MHRGKENFTKGFTILLLQAADRSTFEQVDLAQREGFVKELLKKMKMQL